MTTSQQASCHFGDDAIEAVISGKAAAKFRQVGVYNAYDGIVPGGLPKLFQHLSVLAFCVVVDTKWNKQRFNCLDDKGMPQDPMTKLATGTATRNFLEQKKDGFSLLL